MAKYDKLSIDKYGLFLQYQFMRIIPYKKYEIEIEVETKEIIDFIQKYFVIINNKNSKMNSNLTTIIGKVITKENKIVINFEVRPRGFLIGFYFFCMLLSTFYSFLGLYLTIIGKTNIVLIIESFISILFISFVIIIFGYFITGNILNSKMSSLKKDIEEIIKNMRR